MANSSLEEIRMKLQMMSGSMEVRKCLVIRNIMIDPRPMSEIALHTGLSESSVYRIIAELKGAAQKYNWVR